MAPFDKLEKAKAQIKIWRDSEVKDRCEVWNEVLDTKTNTIVNL